MEKDRKKTFSREIYFGDLVFFFWRIREKLVLAKFSPLKVHKHSYFYSKLIANKNDL